MGSLQPVCCRCVDRRPANADFLCRDFQAELWGDWDGKETVNGDRSREWLLWCLGVDLFANVVAHFGINYMAQLMMSCVSLVGLHFCGSLRGKAVDRTKGGGSG